MIKIISFDLDGTLVKNNYTDLVWLKGLPEIYSKEKNVSFDEAKKILFKEYDRVSNNSLEWYDLDYWFKRFKLKNNWNELLNRYTYAVESFDDVEKNIKNLSKRYKLIISSNAKKEFIDIQTKKIGYKKYFKKMFSSISDFGCVKKNPTFYTKVSKKLKVPPSEIVHVGDSYEFDYISAKNTGIKAYYLDRKSCKYGENVVKSLDEFVKKVI